MVHYRPTSLQHAVEGIKRAGVLRGSGPSYRSFAITYVGKCHKEQGWSRTKEKKRGGARTGSGPKGQGPSERSRWHRDGRRGDEGQGARGTRRQRGAQRILQKNHRGDQ